MNFKLATPVPDIVRIIGTRLASDAGIMINGVFKNEVNVNANQFLYSKE